jgi:hypothetical protein
LERPYQSPLFWQILAAYFPSRDSFRFTKGGFGANLASVLAALWFRKAAIDSHLVLRPATD